MYTVEKVCKFCRDKWITLNIRVVFTLVYI